MQHGIHDTVFRLYELPCELVSDIDLQFMAYFRQSGLHFLVNQHNMPNNDHPLTYVL